VGAEVVFRVSILRPGAVPRTTGRVADLSYDGFMGPKRLLVGVFSGSLLFVVAACGAGSDGANRVAATAREYAFQGIPPTLPAGEAVFTVDNRGGEVHELHLFKLGDGVATVADLLGLSQDEVLDRLESVGSAVAEPGDEESFDAKLSAGRYAVICLIPVGTRAAGDHAGHDMEDMVFDPNADTHFKRGMYAELTVG
jgi:uncharacterized cupredoxin-like copper-binding protein